MWLILSLLVIGVGWAMFAGLQEHIPENFRLLEDRGAEVRQSGPDSPNTASRPAATSERVEGWELVREATNVELRRELAPALQVNAQRYDPPALKVTCYDAKLYVRLDPRLALAGRQAATVSVAGRTAQWARGNGMEVVSPTPALDLKVLMATADSAPLALEFRDFGQRQFALQTDGLLKALQALPAACQPKR